MSLKYCLINSRVRPKSSSFIYYSNLILYGWKLNLCRIRKTVESETPIDLLIDDNDCGWSVAKFTCNKTATGITSLFASPCWLCFYWPCCFQLLHQFSYILIKSLSLGCVLWKILAAAHAQLLLLTVSSNIWSLIT